MKDKPLYDKGYETGYLLGKTAPHVIDIALKELKLPDEFLRGMRKGRKEGERDKRVEEYQKMIADDREYFRSILNEQQKQKDYDKMPEEKKVLKSNKQKAEDLKFRQLQETKDLVTQPEGVALHQWADAREQEIKEGENKGADSIDISEKEKETAQAKNSAEKEMPEAENENLSKEEMRMAHLESLRETDGMSRDMELSR